MLLRYTKNIGVQCTFNQPPCCDCIQRTLHIPWCIIKDEKALSKAIYLGLKNPDSVLDLFHKLLCTKVSIVILSRLKYNASLSVV